METSHREAIGRALGSDVRDARRLSGGDINDAFLVTLADQRRVFAKTNDRASPEMFPAEARGLDWLRGRSSLRVPAVIAHSDPSGGGPAFLVLELIEPGRAQPAFDEALGRGLAELHLATPTQFGLDHDNFVGRLPQSNQPSDDWETFFRESRLRPQLDAAQTSGRATRTMIAGFERLFGKLGALVGPTEPPARLHGDLWGGNLHIDKDGAPCLIDPAVYGGHREIDLAMMQLFGGFSDRVFDAYDEAYPRAVGFRDRVALYQLYPLLVHVNLFGGSYAASVERALSRYV